ncbi:MAG: NAD(P)/FAD-dependent oxidoreductase [Candidatus Omnitrophota bacterium]
MLLSTELFDVAVVGAGPAGSMAAIRAGQLEKKVVLIERNDSIGRKILITGKGRCNITNAASVDEFIEKFGRSGQFLRSAFYAFFNEDLMDFFKSRGLGMKTERQGRVFPETDKAISVIKILEKSLAESKVKVAYNCRLADIKKEAGGFLLELQGGCFLRAKRVILATGGASYKLTGSSGDGFRIAKSLGHSFTALKPGLVPLKTKEPWFKEIQGLTLKNIRITFECGRKNIISEIGELLFTHFGVSGPLVLDLSNEIVEFLWEHKEAALFIDLKPGLTVEQLDKRILREIQTHGAIGIKSLLKELLPVNLVPIVVKLLNLNSVKKINQLAQSERHAIVNLLKALRLTVNGFLPLEEAMVTCGGISTKEINPRTMESRIAQGLYFAGELIDAAASSGGYNLQQAFSTGYLAGESAAND